MAVVTLTVEALSNALRLGSSTEETAEATRLLAYSSEAVLRHAPSATDTALNEAAIRLSGFLYDQPNAGRGLSFAHALRNSGAAAILLPYRIHRAGSYKRSNSGCSTGRGNGRQPCNRSHSLRLGSGYLLCGWHYPDGPPYPLAAVGGCSRERIRLPEMQRRLLRPRRTVRQAAADAAQSDIDAHKANHPSGGAGVDQTARDAAAAAQGTANNAATAATAAADIATANTGRLDAFPAGTGGSRPDRQGRCGRSAIDGGRCADGGVGGTGCHRCP